MYHSTKKWESGPKCLVFRKRIQAVCSFLFLNFYSLLLEFGIYQLNNLVLVLGFVELNLLEMVIGILP